MKRTTINPWVHDADTFTRRLKNGQDKTIQRLKATTKNNDGSEILCVAEGPKALAGLMRLHIHAIQGY